LPCPSSPIFHALGCPYYFFTEQSHS